MTEEEQIIINDITERAADRINELETVNASLREEIERLKKEVKTLRILSTGVLNQYDMEEMKLKSNYLKTPFAAL